MLLNVIIYVGIAFCWIVIDNAMDPFEKEVQTRGIWWPIVLSKFLVKTLIKAIIE